MRLKCIYFLGLTVLALSFRPSSRAQESPDRKAQAMVPAAPTSGLRAGLRRSTLGVLPRAFDRSAKSSPTLRRQIRALPGHWGPSRRQASISRPSRAPLVTNLKSFRL